jgi:hypothetical protein
VEASRVGGFGGLNLEIHCCSNLVSENGSTGRGLVIEEGLIGPLYVVGFAFVGSIAKTL